IVLSGHTDVVPVAGQAWDSDPFELTERAGRLYGRGTADMKGFLAIALAELPAFLSAHPKRPVHLAFTYDEEVGCLGVRRLLEDVAGLETRPRLAVIGEPTDMRVVHTNKGIRGFAVRVEGRAAHSSAPELGSNAILAAARIIERIRALASERREGTAAGKYFDPPYTTVNVGRIEGGTAMNIIAAECRFVWEYRPLPGEPPNQLRDQVVDFIRTEVEAGDAPVPAVTIEELADVPSLNPTEPESRAVAFVRAVVDAEASPTGASFTTEGGLFQASGIPAVICGPGGIAQAHQPNEFVSLQQLEAGSRFVREVLARTAAGAIP
ncbi:MAG: acetylornithine deacetylase, partial [Woeseiaceae bacterium]